MVDFNFSGRPDGLGNRIEEVIRLDAICTRENQKANYVWNNKVVNRSYEILLTSKNIKIAENEIPNIPSKKNSVFSAHLNQEEIRSAAKNIKPNFNINFESSKKPIGIHIRGTDRIGKKNHPHFMRDQNEFFIYLSKTISLANQKRPEYIYICSDNENYRDIFIENLDESITVIQPICDKSLPTEYRDFFALTLCEEIYMCSKFSSFALTASLIGNIPLISFVLDEDVKARYKALFRYELDFPDKINIVFKDNFVSNYQAGKIETSSKRLLKKFKNAFKSIL